MLDELILAKQIGDIGGGSHEAVAIQQLKAGINDLNLTGPLGFEAGDTDLLAGDKLCIVSLGAGHVVQEIGTVLILGIDGGLVIPPALLGLDIGLNTDRIIHRGGCEFSITHRRNLSGSFGGSSFFCGSFLRRGGFLCGGLLRGSGLFCGRSLRSSGGFGGGGLGALSAGSQGEHHCQGENQCKILFHVLPPCSDEDNNPVPLGTGLL